MTPSSFKTVLMLSLGLALPLRAHADPSAEQVSFVNDVIPVLTKVGCNSGACHGALAGKGGFKLSLRGFDPAADHFAMTRQALGRRVDLVEPRRSLVLAKPTLSMPHGGGKKIEVRSPEFEVVANW